MLPSIFGENLFDDFFDDFMKPSRGRRYIPSPSVSVMKTDVKETKDGFELDRSYTSALSKLNYAEIEPGSSIPIVLGYKILSSSDIDIACTDHTHYANQVLCEETYSIKELVKKYRITY